MNINWIARKTINKDKVNNLIESSLKLNHFCNNGPNVELLENLIRDKFKVDDTKVIICVSNGTVACHAIYGAFSFMYHRELKFATQSFTFPSSAQGIMKNTIIVDSSKDGGINLDQVPNDIDGIVVTNCFGNVCDIDKYVNWGKSRGKLVIFDNAGTPFTFYKGKNSINYGNASFISFHHTKQLGFGEGGAIIIDKDYDVAVRNIINFGINNQMNTPWNIYGSNYKMSDLQAVYIIQYLDNMDKIIDHHKKLYKKVNDAGFNLYPNYSEEEPFCFCIGIIFNTGSYELKEKLLKNGIYCRKYYNPLISTIQSNKFYDQIICIPCNSDIREKDYDTIINIING